MPIVQSRRRFLTNAAAFAGAAGLAGVGAAGLDDKEKSLAAERPPETSEIRFGNQPIFCEAPRYIAEELLRAEGFTVRHFDGQEYNLALAHGEDGNFAFLFAPDAIRWLDAGRPITILAGVHVGCFELFGSEQIRSISDLKNRTVGSTYGGAIADLVTLMTSYLGLDPAKDIHWIFPDASSVTPKELFVAGKIDAFLAAPPEPQELRARKIGHVLVNSAVDRPWSQYFCCMLTGNAEFVRKHPAVTKRVVRAVCKGVDLCASEPMRVAQVMVDQGYGYDHVVQTLNDVPYNRAWRDYEPNDTLRFYALRLREAGFIKSLPQKIIAEGSDWRFLNEVKRELKA
jgi:NitT/TauT family transport system substrate-binding protein